MSTSADSSQNRDDKLPVLCKPDLLDTAPPVTPAHTIMLIPSISVQNERSVQSNLVLSPCRLGRVQTALITRALDVLLLVTMAYIPVGSRMSWQTAALVCTHILRSSCANCARPLIRSVLMDHVPPRHRGKVNALESVRTFSWSGSAALGG